MVEYVPFKPSHWSEVELLPSREAGMTCPEGILTSEALGYLVGNSWSCRVDDMTVACGGAVEVWPGRHNAWCYMTDPAMRHIRGITGKAREVLALPKGRIECTVRVDFEPGHKWMKILGFEVETPLLKAYGPYGEDHTGYVRFN